MWTEADDKEFKYGRKYCFTAKDTRVEEYKIRPPDVWPVWNEGVPTKLRRRLGCDPFTFKENHHKYATYYVTLEFVWSSPHMFSELRGNGYNYPNHSGGVYRVFAPNRVIERSCGSDLTGTLYLGRAGTGRNWSNLRTRVKQIIRGGHHAVDNAHFHELIKRFYPEEALAVQWSYMGNRKTLKGEVEHSALLGETWLLACYRDSFGEYPPWNEKG